MRSQRDNIHIEQELIRQREANGSLSMPVWLGFIITSGRHVVIKKTLILYSTYVLYNYFCEGSVQAPDGSPVSYTNWGQGQPDIQPEKLQSVIMEVNGQWFVRPADDKFGFACSIPKIPPSAHCCSYILTY